MEILYRMYNHPNFGLYLFTAITILAILFIIVLIMAIKDAKKAKLLKEKNENDQNLVIDETNEKFNNEEKQENTFAFQEDSNPFDLSSSVNFSNENNYHDENSYSEPNNYTFEPIVEKEEDNSPINDYRIKPEEDFTFQPINEYGEESEFKTAIFNKFNEDELYKSEDIAAPVLEPITEPELKNVFETNKDFSEPTINFEKPLISEEIAKEDYEPINFERNNEENSTTEPIPTVDVKREVSAPKKMPSLPEQFSSVYVNSQPAPEKREEDILPKPHEVKPSPLPIKHEHKEPEIEGLPKIKDLPTPKPIKLNSNQQFNSNLNSLNQIEKETYEIK